MTISWRRQGYLGFMIPLVAVALSSSIFGADNTNALRVALLISAAVVWFLGVQLNANGEDADGQALHQTYGFAMQWAAWVPLLFFGLSFT